MADGFSDKGISPCTYTPGLTNVPQVENTVVVAGDAGVGEVAKISSKIEPFADWLLRLASLKISGDIITPSAGSTVGPNIIETNDGYYLMASSSTGYIYKVKKDFSSYVKGMNIGGNTRYFFREVPGTNNIILSGPGLWHSPDNFVTLAALPMETGHTFVTNASAPSWMDTSSSSMLIGGCVVVGSFYQPAITKFNPTNPAQKARTIMLPSANTGANLYCYSVCSLGNGVFIATTNTGAAPLYIYRSTDSGETWTLVQTCGSDYQAYAGVVYTALQGGCVAVGSHSGYFNISKDLGLTWSRVSLSTFPVEIHPSFLSSIPAGLLLGNPTFYHWYAYASSDYGVSKTNMTWRTVYTTKTGITSDGKAIFAFSSEAPPAEKMTFFGVFEFWKESFVDFPVDLYFKPTEPANLASIPPITFTLDTSSRQGVVKPYMSHFNDEIGQWCSLSDVPGEWTLLGELSASGNLSVPSSFAPRKGEKVRFRFGFKSTDPAYIKSPPSLVSISIPWASDVSAPSSPSFFDFSDASGVSVGYRVEFGDLPTGSRHIILEGKVNDGDYMPFSNRAKFESGHDYLKFRGALDSIEAAGERNEKHIDFRTGLEKDDKIRVKIAAEDGMGNRSSFTESSELVLSGITYRKVQVDQISDEVSDADEITEEIS